MNSAGKIDALLEWCSENGLVIDGRLSIKADEHGGIAVFSGGESIPAGQIAVTIPKGCVLSTQSCTLSDFITPALVGPEAQLAISAALYTEILFGCKSRWFGYLLSLPEAIDLPIFWEPEMHDIDCPSGLGLEDIRDVDGALGWLRGTEAEKILRNGDVQSSVTLDRLQAYFKNMVLPLVSCHMPGYDARLDGFMRAYCLVSSRAFLVDAFHGLAMVPIADAFNHIQENHVHLESDYNVCPECGSLDECPHDREGDDHIELATSTTTGHDCYEMVTNTTVPPFSEVYNTYGETLSSAELLCQYGFLLEVNDNDALTWTVEEILDIALITPKTLRTIIVQRCSNYLEEFDFDDTQCLISNPDPKGNRRYIINADGQASIQLWALLLTISAQKVSTEIRGMLPSLYELHTLLETRCGGSDSDDTTACDSHDSVGALVRRVGDGCPGILRRAYQLLVGLCQARKGKTGKAQQGDDLWDILEVGPLLIERGRVLTVLVGFGWQPKAHQISPVAGSE